jgi:hypothetical protein
VDVDDQFGSTETKLVRPGLFCNPVNKNGEGISNPSTHLTCYDRALLTKWDRTPEQLTATDQFGEWALDVRSQWLKYCVPSVDVTDLQQQAAGASSSALLALPATEIDDFNLYWAKTTPRTPKFERREVNLVDQWIDDDVEVIRPLRFGTPAKDTPPPSTEYKDEFAKLTCYKIRRAGKFEKRDVTIQNEFGQETLTVKKPYLLCLPSEQPVEAEPD